MCPFIRMICAFDRGFVITIKDSAPNLFLILYFLKSHGTMLPLRPLFPTRPCSRTGQCSLRITSYVPKPERFQEHWACSRPLWLRSAKFCNEIDYLDKTRLLGAIWTTDNLKEHRHRLKSNSSCLTSTP